MTSPLAGDLPVGSVLPYVGTDPRSLEADGKGWMLCRKRELDRASYAELFTAIGVASGAPNDRTFNLPDYQGYFLRGMDGGRRIDPDAASRSAAYDGGNSGDNVGSVQQYATAYPNAPYATEVPHLPDGQHRAYRGTSAKISSGNEGSVTVAIDGGGDDETRPKNKYVHFIIKTHSLDTRGNPVEVPVGAIVSFAGNGSPDPGGAKLMECDGSAYNCTGDYEALFKVIGTSQGGDGAPNFCIPELRGYFLRGVAEGQLTDPDRNQRLPARPDLASGGQGNSGDKVGSSQEDAAALPNGDIPLRISVPNLPTDEYTSDTTLGKNSTNWNAGSIAVQVSTRGGDAETRPTNVAIRWFIRY